MTASGSNKKRICSKRSSTALSCFFLKALQIASRSCDGLRFGSLLHKERSRMAKGMSPLRLFMRNAPRKTVADGIDGSSSGPDATAQSTRQPLGPITESIVRNPLITVAEQSSGDASTPRAKAKVSSTHGQEKFPHLENSEVFASSINTTPDKTASSQSKGKFTWQHRHGSTAQNTPRDGPPLFNTPPRPPKGGFGCSDGQAANNSQDTTLQSVSHHLRGGSTTGGGSVPSTPKTGRSVGGKSTTESENGGSHSQNVTPCKSVSRSLKYQQQGSANNSGASGLTSVRSTVSQHVITRPMGYLQAAKGVLPQTTNQNFVEHHFELEEDASFWRDHNVQVIIRTRPLSNSELISQGSNRCLKQESPHVLSWLGQPESRFTFDHVAGEAITQAKLFDIAGLPMVENCMSGYNSCMFAYGQTGSGKTHTMLGDIENLDRSPSENRGMTPRVFEYLFARIRTEQECRRHEHLKFFCKCSFLEIYNEQITDLLEPSSTNLQMREDAKKGVYVENLSEVEVQCVQDVIQLLLQGASNRKVAATNMNRESSRSHSVFTCVVESKWENNSMTNSRYGRLHLVDLAGSERQKSSGAEGGRLKEAASINKSLSTLGLVIMILVDVANGRQRHVPYRDSKLTFLLQDSLGGNSKTIMIANVSPASCCAMETLSTLKFAQRAKFIRNNAIINEDASGDVIALRHEIEELKVEVDRLRREKMLRVSSSRILALENGSVVAGQMCGDKFDASTLDCDEIEGSTSDPRNANKSQTVSIANDKQLRSIEAVLAGALRREQQAEDITKKLAAEIEQLNRLVRQREEDSQCSKMMLRFREEKIRRLEGIADNVISAEAFYEDERKNLIDELQLIRGRLDRNPELTRFAMENIRLMEELRRYQEFYDGGERDVLLEEISGLRSQLLDMLDTKVGEEQIIGKLLTPQKRALVPELSALERENELLLIEVKTYQNELKECRNNLNSCLVANADLSRQVDELEATVKQLKNERFQKFEESLVPLDDEFPDKFFSGASLPPPQEVTSSADPTTSHIRLETEEVELQQRQALANVEEQVLELRNQLKEAQDLIQKLTSEVEEANELSDRRKLNENTPCIAEDDAVVRQGLQDRWEKLQEIEMRHSEEITQLQLELDSMEEVLKEERQQRLLADQRIDDLSSQLSATVSKLEQAQGLAEDSSTEERQQRLMAEQRSEELSSELSAVVSKLEEAQCVVEALEGQQLFSINELENLQSEHTKLLRKMKQQEEGGEELQKQFQDENTVDDEAVSILEQKLLRTKRGKEEARRMNRQFQQEKASRMALDKERELTMSEVETQAALAITTLQSEILELREEVSLAAESEATAKLQISHLQDEVESLRQTIGELEDTNRCLSDKSDEYRNLVDEKHAQLQGLEMDWESSASMLIGVLSDGDEALSEAVREMEEIKQTKIQEISRIDDKPVEEKRDTAKSVSHRLQGVQLRETEGEVRTSDAKDTNFAFEDGEAMIRESDKKSIVAFLMVRELLERISDLKSAQHRLVQDNQQAFLREASKDIEAAALQQELEELRRQYEELQAENELVIGEREDLREENLSSSLEFQRNEKLKADCMKLEKEIQESWKAIEEKDMENRNLHRQFDENRINSTLMSDRYQLLAAAHEELQQEQARYLEDDALKFKEREEQVRLSEKKAMAALVVSEQLLGVISDWKASNIGLAKEIEDGRLLLAEKQTTLDTLEQKLEQSAHQCKEIADQYELLLEANVNLQQEHSRLVGEAALRVEEGKALVKFSERKAMAAFVVVEDLLERVKDLQKTTACLAMEIGEAHVTLEEKDTALTALQNELSGYSDVAMRYHVLEEAHENLRQDHERFLEETALRVEEGEAVVKLSERKAMAAFVVVEHLVERVKELKTTNTCLAKEIGEAHVTLGEKDTALAALENELSEYSHVATSHQVLGEAYESLRQDHERFLAETALRVEEGEAAVKLSERKAMAAFVVVEHLVERVKELQRANTCLAMEIGEAHVTLGEKDTALAALENELSEYSHVALSHQVLGEAYESLRQDHERFLAETALRVEEGEAGVKLSERKAMAAFVVVEHLVERVKELQRTNTCLAMEIGEAHVILGEKDTALAALESELSEYSHVATSHQVLGEAYESLRQDHERFLAETALRVEEGEAGVKLSERKAMAAFVVVEHLVERVKELKTTNTCLAKEIGEAHATSGEKDTALAALQDELSEYSDVARTHQVLEETHENLRQDHERFLAETALRVEEGEAGVKLSERKAMAAFVVVEHLVERVKELKTANTFLAKEIGEAYATSGEKDTALAALQDELSEYSDVARTHQVLEETYENLQQHYERLVQEHVLSTVDWDRQIKLCEKRAMATLVILRQVLDGKEELKEETEKQEKEIQEAHVALAERNANLHALAQKLEQSGYHSSDIADKHQKLICAHDILGEQHERLQKAIEKARERHETLEEELVRGLEEQERLRQNLEKEREDHEGLRKELVKAQDDHESFVGESVLTAEEQERMIKLSEKKAIVCLILVEHVMERLKVLKLTKLELENQIQEERVAQSEKESRLKDLQHELEESHAFQKAVCDENQLLLEKQGNLYQQLGVMELGLRNSNAEVSLLQDVSVTAEQQYTEAYNNAIKIVMKANSLHEMKYTECLELFMTDVRDGLELLCDEVSTAEEAVAQLCSVGRELGTCRSKVLMLEEENDRNLSAVESYQTEISRLVTTLQLKERDLNVTLEKETTSSNNWESERATLVFQIEQSKRDCLESEKMVQSLLSDVQRLDLTVKEAELRVSDMLTTVEALTVAKQELELENTSLVLGARQGETNFSEKELQITAIRDDLADVRARLSAAELREQSVSERVEELTAATVEWEVERAVVEHEMLQLREEKHQLRSDVSHLNLEMEKREISTLESFRRSQEAFEVVEARLTAMEEELSRLEMSKGKLEDDMALLESAASGDAFALEEKELECLELKRQLGIVVVQINQVQTAIDLAAAQLALDLSNREADNSRTEEGKCSCDIQPREEIVTAELVSTQGSLTTEVQRLDSSLKQTEFRVSEMLNGVKALTVAVEELELEKFRLVLAASQAEMRCTEKEQELVATQGDLAGLRSKLVEAELHEKSLSGQMEELTGAKLRLEVERADATRLIEEMRQEKDELRLDLTYVNAEVEERERVIFESFRRSQQALERVDARMITMELELGGLETCHRNLENDLALLDSAATSSSVALEEKEHKYLEMQRRVENAEVQMYEMQAVADSVMAQVASQGDLAGLRSKLVEAQLHEKSLSGQMEELTGAKLRLEVERVNATRVIEEMRQEKDKLRFDLTYVNAEVEERERAIFESFRRSQQVLERVDARMITMEQELGGLETCHRNLEKDLALLDSAATISSVALEEKEHKYLEMQRRVENAEVQMYEMQAIADSVMAQVVLERDNWEANKRRMKDENDAREIELRDEIASAELKLVATEGSLKFAVENVEELSLSIRGLEEEILKLNEDAKTSLLKVTEQQQQIDTLRETSMALKAECTEADASIAALNQLREQYLLAEASWRTEQELLTRKLEELEVSAGQIKSENVSNEESGVSKRRGELSQCLPECNRGWEDQEQFEEAHQCSRQKQEIQVLRAKISEKDRTILSAKKEMQIAIANLKEAELEMDKVHRENHKLTQIELENKSLVESLSLKFKTAEEELLKRDTKIEGCEAELQKVVGVMSDWETNMHDVEIEWRKEKEALALELTEAKLVANEKRTEAGALLQKFHDGQATLKEAEDLVDALVKANEHAKHDALGWKSEKESLRIVQGWWMPERDKLVSKVARLETDMHTQKQDIWIMCMEEVNGLVATIDLLLAVDKELSELKNQHQQDLDYLALEMKALKGDLVARLLDLEGEMMSSFQEMQSVVCELTSKNRALKDLADLKVVDEQRIVQSLQTMNSELKAVENERDKYQTDLVVLREQLEMAQALADQREIVAAEASQAAERSKSFAEEKEEEARILERSVQECESTVYALESQLDIVKRESERQRVATEDLEKELEALKLDMELMQVTVDSQEAKTVRDIQGAETSKTDLYRTVIEMKNQQIQARKSVESLQQECAEKDVQLRSCKAHIAELMLGAEKQASENQQKLKTLEAMVDLLKVEERKVNPAGGSVSKAVEKSTGKVKGAGSPFKCIGSGLDKQRSSEMDEELSAAKKRIKELETLSASRQKEVFMLNTKLAEAESMTHDVVRDLLGVKMDIASYATLLNQQQVQRMTDQVRRRTVEAQQKEDELDTLRDRLNEFIEERESWLEEINRRQAEAVAARVSAEKLRLRDETLTAENDKFREDNHTLRKKVADLDDEIKKLSGQQNLQQRIHHHAKIKEENNSFRLQNEDLSGKLRRMEILFTRVNDELARYRTAEGKSPFLNFDEEARLQKKLQETEENRLQVAETLIGLCTGIMQAAGIQRASRDLDPSAAMIALHQLQDRLESLERELSDCKLKARIAVEKRRLSELRDFHTPVKAICTTTNFIANQQLPSPVSSSR